MVFDLFYSLIESIVLIVKELGYTGIILGMAIESSFIPFPSEVILIPAGALAATGDMNLLLVILSGILGGLIGALINYYLALFLGRPVIENLVHRHGKMFLLNQKSIDRSDKFFEKHGEITTFVGRLIPMVRQLISIPAGFSRMSLPKFVFFTTLGVGIWTSILAYMGYLFGNNLEWVDANKNAITIIVLISCLALIIAYLIYNKRRLSRDC
jgi:membrane protein DedA with SNARE-associated domain|tara:strand:+ start:13741 stop:14376 length:636 start_codon:yes stop_codon:yes gene_type:complete